MICVDIDENAIESFRSYLKSKIDDETFKKISFEKFDIRLKSDIDAFIDHVKQQYERVDILINLAGIMNKGKLFTELNEQEIHKIFQINLFSQIWLCQGLLPQMIENESGHIVNMSSALGLFGTYKLTDYCATKFAVFGFTEALRNEIKIKYPKQDLKVSIICPFHVKTKLFNGFTFNSLKWLNISSTPEYTSKLILDGILLNKELIGIPRFSLYGFALLKQ